MDSPSLPSDFLTRLEQEYPHIRPLLAEALELKSPVSIRYHAKKASSEKNKKPVLWNPYGSYLEERPEFILDPLWHAGTYYVQEASSMGLWQALKEIDWPSIPKVLDLCAAPGGKSTLLADYLETHFDDYILVCNEVVKSRANILRDNMIKWGYANTIVLNNDPKKIADKLGAYFDLVVVDAPCSGEGMFRKDPLARIEWSAEHVVLCDLRQKRILEESSKLIHDNGYLIYSTCTYNHSENMHQVQYFCNQYDYHSIPIAGLQRKEIVEINMKDQHAYQFFPGMVQGEGFFISLLKNNGRKILNKWKPSKKKQKDKVKNLPFAVEKEQFHFIDMHGNIRMVLGRTSQEQIALSELFYCKKVGIEIGKLAKAQLIPSHELALHVDYNTVYPNIGLTREQAIQYLRKEEVLIDASPGWYRATFEGHGLGWIKVLKGRTNNYYPKNLRILKK